MISVRRALASVRQRGLRRSWQSVLNHLEDMWFDLVNGTDTYRRVEQADLEVKGSHQPDANPYYPTRGRALRKALQHFALPLDGTFVDLGAGKGKMLLLAVQHGFRRAVGVEFAPQLSAVAETNVARMRRSLGDARIENRCIDATQYQFGSDDNVIFMFSPFGARVMDVVMANLRVSVDESPRRIHIIYTQADLVDLITRHLPVHERACFVYGGHEFVLLSNR